MLEFIRKSSGSIVVRGLFVILILGFIVWGVGDVIRVGASSERVARVAGIDITPNEVRTALQRETEMLSRMMGRALDAEQVRAMGLARSALDSVIERTLYGLAARDLGIAVSDALVGREIMSNEAFRGASGAFDRIIYQQTLQNAGLPTLRFERSVREDMTRLQLLDAIRTVSSAPGALADPLFAYRLEKRVAETFVVSGDIVTGLAEPTEDDLVKFHRDNAGRFTAPEYRALTVALLDVEDLTREVAVSPDKVRQAFTERQADYVVPERRRLLHMVLADEAQATKARDLVAGGRDFAEIAKELTGAAKDAVDLGLLSRQELEGQLPELAEPAFTLADATLSAPIKSPLGVHLIKITGVEKGHAKTFNDVKDEITRTLAHELALSGLVSLANKLEDALGGGANLDEAATKVGAKLVKFEAVDATGRGPNGQPVTNLPVASRFLDVAFETRESGESALTETDKDGYFVVRVDRIKVPELKPLASVRDEVVAAWKSERRDEATRKLAEGYLERAKKAEPIATLAAEAKTNVLTTAPLTRQPGEAAQGLPPALIASLFTIKPGEATMARGTNGYHIARLKELKPADPAADRAERENVARQLARSIESDLLSQYLIGLREHYPVTIDEQALEKLL